MNNIETRRLADLRRALAAESACLAAEVSSLDFKARDDKEPGVVAARTELSLVNSLMDVLTLRCRLYGHFTVGTALRLQEKFSTDEPSDSGHSDSAPEKRTSGSSHSRKPRPVLGMDLDTGIVAEFPSTARAAVALQGPSGRLHGGSVGRKAERMTVDLWMRGPAAIRLENARGKYSFMDWAFIYADALEKGESDNGQC